MNLETLIECVSLHARLSPLAEKIRSADSAKDRWNALREFYAIATPEILKYPANEWAIDPYAGDWVSLFTPIEYGLWCDIRSVGAVMYPQYPVGRYFVDFANPVAQVAIECDGAAFHTDRAKDEAREKTIRALGWCVYRFTGRDCMEPDELEDEDSPSGFRVNPKNARTRLEDIAVRHGLR